MTINKYQMATRLKNQLGCSHAYATTIIESFSDVIMKELLQGNAVNFNKIGKFSLLTKKSRIGTNPQTRKSVIIPETIVIKFKNFDTTRRLLNNR